MKKLLLGLATFSILISVSCTKEEEDRIIQATEILGNWEQTGGDGFVACPVGDNARIDITDAEFRQYFTSPEGCLSLGYLAISYEFDGKVIYSLDGLITYKVLSADANSLHLSDGKKTSIYTKMIE